MAIVCEVQANPVIDWVAGNVSVFSEADYEGDFILFAMRKHEFKKQYASETNMNLDLALLGIKNRYFLMFRSEIRGGMGDSPTNMLLHPYSISYGIIPTLEYRFNNLHVSTGLDHRCFHWVDQHPPEAVVYWNKMIITLNSPHRRVHPFLGAYISDESWTGLSRLMWSFTWGYYIKEFFGLIEPAKLMTQTRPLYLHDFQLKARCGVVRWSRGAVTLTGASLLGFKYNDAGTYWAQETGAEVFFSLRPFDTSLFVNYILDDGRFNSKDRLIEFGIRAVR